MAMAMGKIYTFGPTFRAEKSKTRRHLSEFWMIEPEMAFCDIFENMDTIENFLRAVVLEVIEKCPEELEILGRDISKLETVAKPFPRMSYDEAVEILKGNKDVDWAKLAQKHSRPRIRYSSSSGRRSRNSRT